MSKTCEVKKSVKIRPTKDVWNEYDVDSPQFFQKLELAEDGGFSDVHSLFRWRAIMAAGASASFFVINVYYLVVPNIMNLMEHRLLEPPNQYSKHLIANWILSVFMTEKALNKYCVVAIHELFIFTVLVVQSIYHACKACSGSKSDKWCAIAHMMWSLYPEFKGISAMKCLKFVSPGLLFPRLQTEVVRMVRRRMTRYGIPLARFCLSRAAIGLIGFDAFMIKYRITTERVDNSKTYTMAFIVSIAFLNQMLSIVQVPQFAKRRLFIFVFGGEDAFMSVNEETVCRVWLGMLVRRMWAESKALDHSFLWFLVVTLAYSDNEFQQLVLKEHRERELEQECSELPEEKLEALRSPTWAPIEAPAAPPSGSAPTWDMLKKVQEVHANGNVHLNLCTGQVQLLTDVEFAPAEGPEAMRLVPEFKTRSVADTVLRDVARLSSVLQMPLAIDIARGARASPRSQAYDVARSRAEAVRERLCHFGADRSLLRVAVPMGEDKEPLLPGRPADAPEGGAELLIHWDFANTSVPGGGKFGAEGGNCHLSSFMTGECEGTDREEGCYAR